MTVNPPTLPVETPLVPWASTWPWRHDETAIDPLWAPAAFDDQTWATGPAPLGFGASAIATTVYSGAASTRPRAAHFRRSGDLGAAPTADDLVIEAIADDGVVVYLNGQELGRRNMPTGVVTQASYAVAAPTHSTAAGAPLRLVFPVTPLTPGRVVVAAETHLNYRTTADVSFDLRATLVTRGTP